MFRGNEPHHHVEIATNHSRIQITNDTLNFDYITASQKSQTFCPATARPEA
jgi:hypothetical protein